MECILSIQVTHDWAFYEGLVVYVLHSDAYNFVEIKYHPDFKQEEVITAVLQDMKNAADAIRAAYQHVNETVEPSLQGQAKYDGFKFSFGITL